MKSQQCAPLKHHYDECAERVMQQQEENGKADEDCVEECMLKRSLTAKLETSRMLQLILESYTDSQQSSTSCTAHPPVPLLSFSASLSRAPS
jgi:DNA-binding ferritin-like protein